MNVEFHYYSIYALALEAGFDDNTAFIIASSSQEVDASTDSLSFATPKERVDIAITQNYIFWDDNVKYEIYIPFHFMPGSPQEAAENRIDGKSNKYLVTANSDNAKEILIAALKEKNPYLIGIALHTFADTWAHQNFSGINDNINLLQADSVIELPPVGHLQALKNPDEINQIWNDYRLKKSLVNNNNRFCDAAKKIFRYLRIYLGKSFADDELVVDRLKTIWSKNDKSERLSDYVITWNMRPYEAGLWRVEAGGPVGPSLRHNNYYDKVAWLAAKFKENMTTNSTVCIPASSALYSTNIYRWNEAANEHKKRVIAMLKGKGF